MEKFFFRAGSLLAGLAVGVGAYSAHGATKTFSADAVRWISKAARYQMYHALALLAVAWALTQWAEKAKLLQASGWLFLAGTILFAGSLYVMAFTGIDLGYLTPAGGVAYMLGWVGLAAVTWNGE